MTIICSSVPISIDLLLAWPTITRFPHCLEKNLSPKQLSHPTGLFDYSASSFKPNSFTEKHFYTRSLNTETLLHRDAVTHRAFDTTHKRFYTQTLLLTEACTHRLFYTPIYLQRDTFTHRRLYRLTSSQRDFFFALYALCVASESCAPQRPLTVEMPLRKKNKNNETE